MGHIWAVYTILRTLAILDDTGAHLPLSSTLLFVGLDCQQLSHGVNFTCQFDVGPIPISEEGKKSLQILVVDIGF